MSHLQQLEKKYLCNPSTCVAAECLFSKAGELTSKRRSGLKPANVNMLLFLNKKFLQIYVDIIDLERGLRYWYLYRPIE